MTRLRLGKLIQVNRARDMEPDRQQDRWWLCQRWQISALCPKAMSSSAPAAAAACTASASFDFCRARCGQERNGDENGSRYLWLSHSSNYDTVKRALFKTKQETQHAPRMKIASVSSTISDANAPRFSRSEIAPQWKLLFGDNINVAEGIVAPREDSLAQLICYFPNGRSGRFST